MSSFRLVSALFCLGFIPTAGGEMALIQSTSSRHEDFFNRKGLFPDRGERKGAFFIPRDYYKSMESK